MTDASGRTVEVNGTALYSEDHGEGPPVVLIHGGFGSSRKWAPVVPELADLRVVMPDSRGHGHSPQPGRGPLLRRHRRRRRRPHRRAGPGAPGRRRLERRRPGRPRARCASSRGREGADRRRGHPDFDAGGLREAHRALLDELIPLDLSIALYRALPDAELAVGPSLGHTGPTPDRARSSRA